MFYFPRDFDPKNHAARRWLRRIGPETYRKKPELKDDLAEELERPMPSPLQGEEPKTLWEIEQEARERDLL